MTTTIFVAKVTADDGAIEISKAFFNRNRAFAWANSVVAEEKKEREQDEELASRPIKFEIAVIEYEIGDC